MSMTIPGIDKHAIGTAIRSKREQRSLTQDQLASQFGWNKQVISDVESGKAVSLEKLMVLSGFLKISLDGLRDSVLHP